MERDPIIKKYFPGLHALHASLQERSDMHATNPALLALEDPIYVKQAKMLLEQTPGIIDSQERFISDLSNESVKKPAHIVMGIRNHRYPVLTVTEKNILAVLPILRCTQWAMKDLASGSNMYRIISSTSTTEKLLRFVETLDPEVLLVYSRDRLSPQDYLALISKGIIFNEVFRITLPRKTR